MSVVGSDYDELKQYNLAEIYNPTPKLAAKMSNGAASEVGDRDDNPPSDVAATDPGPRDVVVSTDQSDDDKTSLDSQRVAEDNQLTAL